MASVDGEPTPTTAGRETASADTASGPQPACEVCANVEGNRSHRAREMMFGLRKEFTYLECASCGCLQLLDVPADLSPYYPDDYYAFGAPATHQYSWLHRILRRQKQSYCMGRTGNLLGRLLSRRQPPDLYIQWLLPGGVSFSSAILDVGCGAGHLLRDLHRDGFTNLTGIDPYLRDEIHEPGLNTYKRTLSETTGAYDFIIMNHAFEHLPEPAQALAELWRLVRPGGMVCIRIPIAASYAWRTYGVDWLQLDAPRHLFLHTRKSMDILAAKTGFTMERVVYDSYQWQFAGSECYRLDIPFVEFDKRNPFGEAEMRAFDDRAAELNRLEDGDQACFYLRKPGRP